VLEIRNVPHARAVRLDGRPLQVAFDSTAHTATVALSLDRATGYHQLQIQPGRHYLFGTEDAKLKIAGVVEMLAFLRTHAGPLGLSWNGTVYFSANGQVLRDARLDIAWLERNLSEVATIAESISLRPFVVSRRMRERARSGVPDVAATAALLRRSPELMERHSRGSLTIDGERWSPRELVRTRRESTTDTQGNRRVTRLLLAVAELARNCQRSAPAKFSEEIGVHVDTISTALRRQPFAQIRRQHGHMRVGTAVAREEQIDERYRRARTLLQDLLGDRPWDPMKDVSEEWAFAQLADQVYQSFCAILVARAFGLESVASLASPGPHFEGEDHQMWVDATPPTEVLRNWRNETEAPSDLRPDIVLRRKSDSQVAILDAKYRSTGTRATPDSLSEVQLYLQAFGARKVSVLYPQTNTGTTPQPRVITNDLFGITELPLGPMDDLGSYITEVFRPTIERSFHSPIPVSKEAAESSRADKEAGVVQATAVRTLVADGEVVRLAQPTAMLATENNLRRLLDPFWTELGEDVRKMLITAEYFGDQVPAGFDHSGPVLGLFAACERLTRDRLFTPSAVVLGAEFRRVTFGETGETLRRLPKWRGGREQALRNWASSQSGVDIEALGRCGRAMLTVNKWRIAAAHAVLVDKETWDKSHTIILGTTGGLLGQLTAALPD
jgi:hypothetical protein